MKQFLLSLLLLAGVPIATFPQTGKSFNADDLKISFDLAYQGISGAKGLHSDIKIKNSGKVTISRKDWTVYFNSSAMSVTGVDTLLIKINRVNGDLFSLTPGSNFSLKPDSTYTIDLNYRGIKNSTDYPQGFYLSWNSSPSVGYPLKGVSVTPVGDIDRVTLEVAEQVFQKNRHITPVPENQLVKVFPSPVNYSPGSGSFAINKSTIISSDPAFKTEAGLLAYDLGDLLGAKPQIQSSAPQANVIVLKKADKNMGDEAYQLNITPGQIEISASASAGIFYGIQSLKTLIDPRAWAKTQTEIRVPAVSVNDAPRFAHRAFMLDVSRNFHSMQEVLKVLDVMALYKLNVFHLHFSDDEGWRIQIPGLPELTSVGAKRGPTANNKDRLIPSRGSGAETPNSGTGYYSRADFIKILKYARDRHIRVIPEIESPGHARAAIKAMDARYDSLMKLGKKAEAEQYMLRDIQDKSVYRSVQGYDDNVINVALPSTYRFMEKVVDELRKMYAEADAPLTTIHFGGDEVPRGTWQNSPAVDALMKSDPSVKTVNDLWYYYFGKINKMLEAKNLYLSGWEETGLKKVVSDGRTRYVPNADFADDNLHVDVWNNGIGSGSEDLAYRLANAGIKVVLSNVTNFYFDLASNYSFNEPGLYWGGYIDLDKPFYFIPYNYLSNLKDAKDQPINPASIKGKETLSDAGRQNIVGIQAALWSETIKNPQRLEFMLLPKLLALAERAWTKQPEWAEDPNSPDGVLNYYKDWSHFVSLLSERELPRLDYYHGGYAYRIPTPGLSVNNGTVEAIVQLPAFKIRYTTDGTEPGPASALYTRPVTQKGTLKFRVFNSSGRGGQTVSFENK